MIVESLMMFEDDRSASRGLMTTRKLIAFQHASALGNERAAVLFDKVSFARKDPAKPARAWSDYAATVTPTNPADFARLFPA